MTWDEYKALVYPDHAHCPYDCEHPQPFEDFGVAVCGACWFINKELTPMVLCTPETCED